MLASSQVASPITDEPFLPSHLLADANCPINIDSKSYEITKKNMENNPNNRWIFDEAAGHVYQLMKNDSYPRYLRSDMYKEYLNGTKKKVRISAQVTPVDRGTGFNTSPPPPLFSLSLSPFLSLSLSFSLPFLFPFFPFYFFS